ILIILFTILYLYTPLKDIFFKKQIAEETNEETIEPTKEISEESKEGTIELTEEESSIPEGGEWTFIDAREAKHQGIVTDIDYENKIITIENANTGEIEILDEFDKITAFTYIKIIGDKIYTKDGNFEDIKIGYYITVATRGDFVPDAEEPDFIFGIDYSEERWW
ncbi:unnamed protein product, partial [marine sediment metagenome]